MWYFQIYYCLLPYVRNSKLMHRNVRCHSLYVTSVWISRHTRTHRCTSDTAVPDLDSTVKMSCDPSLPWHICGETALATNSSTSSSQETNRKSNQPINRRSIQTWHLWRCGFATVSVAKLLSWQNAWASMERSCVQHFWHQELLEDGSLQRLKWKNSEVPEIAVSHDRWVSCVFHLNNLGFTVDST